MHRQQRYDRNAGVLSAYIYLHSGHIISTPSSSSSLIIIIRITINSARISAVCIPILKYTDYKLNSLIADSVNTHLQLNVWRLCRWRIYPRCIYFIMIIVYWSTEYIDFVPTFVFAAHSKRFDERTFAQDDCVGRANRKKRYGKFSFISQN